MSLQGTLRRIENAVDEQDFHTARELVDAELLRHDDRGILWELLGTIAYRQGDFHQCLHALETATMLAPLSDRSRVLIAVAYVKTGHQGLGLELLAEGTRDGRVSAFDASLWLLAAAGFGSGGRPDEALRCCRRAAELAPEEGEAFYQASRYGERCGLSTPIVESLARRAVALEPRAVSFRVGLSTLLQRSGRERDAWEVVSELTARDIAEIDCECCLRTVADLCVRFGDHDRAEVCQQRLAEQQG